MTRALVGTTTTLIAGPAVEPLDLDQCKKHLRFSPTTEDTLIDGWISAARQYFEEQTGRQLIQATYELWLDAFPLGVIELPRPPLLTVESVGYVGSDGTVVDMDQGTYSVKAPAGPQAGCGWIQRGYGVTWPTVRTGSSFQDDVGAVRVRFTAGYGSTPGDVPELVRSVLYLLVANFHKYRADQIETHFGSALSQLPLGVDAFMRGFKYTALPKYPPRSQLVTML